MRKHVPLFAVIGLSLTGCNPKIAAAEKIVRNELGGPTAIEFRNLRSHPSKEIVCGDVMASDRPDGGWRYFVAYTELGRAVVSPPGGITPEGEMGNPLLSGAADQFNHACD